MAPTFIPNRSREASGSPTLWGSARPPNWETLFGSKIARLGVNQLKKKLAIMEREAREKGEPQALQATEKTTRKARTARRTRAKDHEEHGSKRGESKASMTTAIGMDGLQPLLGRCAASPGV